MVALVGEQGELGLLEVWVEVQIRGNHRCNLDPSSFPEVNLFCLQKLRKSLYVTKQGDQLGTH